MRLALLAALLAASMLVLGACAQRETHEQYERRVAQSYEQRTLLLSRLPEEQDPDYFLQAMEAFQEDIARLREINPPASVEQGHEAYLRSLEGSVRLLQRLANCRALARVSQEESRACIQGISSEELDQIENDFVEAKAIFEAEGYQLEGL